MTTSPEVFSTKCRYLTENLLFIFLLHCSQMKSTLFDCRRVIKLSNSESYTYLNNMIDFMGASFEVFHAYV